MKVAVLPLFDKYGTVNSLEKNRIRTDIITAINNSGLYIAIDMRSVDDIIDFHSLHLDRVRNENDYWKLEKEYGTKYFLNAEVDGGALYIIYTVSLIEIKSGDLVYGDTIYEYSEKSIQSVQKASVRIFSKIFLGKTDFADEKNIMVFTDPRDGKTYKTIQIGEQTWMAENLIFETAEGSWCYENDSTNCEKYGRLYDWSTANNVCPEGWRLPSENDFKTLLKNVGFMSGQFLALREGGLMGYNALCGGYRRSDGHYCHFENYGFWWSSSEDDGNGAWYMTIYKPWQSFEMFKDNNRKVGFSVRCIKN